MTGAPRISVYVPSHNYGRFLADAIESVLRQSVDDWELIVVDDGSTDETPDVVNLYRGHPKISVHRTEGIGLPAVCNYALARAKGKYVIRLDGDDVFDENILLVLGNMLDRDPQLALAFPDYFLVDHFGEVFAQERRERLYSTNHMLDLPPNGACTLVRADVLKEVGGYREDLGAQDGFDLWTKVTNKYKSANINLPLFYYRRHGTNLTTNTQRILSARQRINRTRRRKNWRRCAPSSASFPAGAISTS
jgi:glycosyltransferase involved in cell wall biosynthesis